MRFALALVLAVGCSRGGGTIALSSPAFGDGQSIPVKYTCSGENVSPPLQWSNVPAGTKSLTLTVNDPDAPGGHFTHWQVTEIPPTTTGVAEGGHVGVEGENGFGNKGWGGPCPPSGEHRYVFTLVAHDAAGREVGRGTLTGRYRK
jgi:Raf kinase inhibitor-like YbhB/YbcL family protein